VDDFEINPTQSTVDGGSNTLYFKNDRKFHSQIQTRILDLFSRKQL
jgi:hypothetical protein